MIILGFIIITFTSSITGNIIGENLSKGIGFILGLALVIGGLVILLTKRQISEGGLAILISDKAAKKLRKDKGIKERREWYIGEIRKIAQDPTSRPQERMGQFNVSPRGSSPEGRRIVWNYDSERNRLLIQDLVRHESKGRYSGYWNKKVRKGQIIKTDYGNYHEFRDVA